MTWAANKLSFTSVHSGCLHTESHTALSSSNETFKTAACAYVHTCELGRMVSQYNFHVVFFHFSNTDRNDVDTKRDKRVKEVAQNPYIDRDKQNIRDRFPLL